jgi:hypothetical protein
VLRWTERERKRWGSEEREGGRRRVSPLIEKRKKKETDEK